jgi:peptidoglycan/LPS O-acetylase OafA/YrhL
LDEEAERSIYSGSIYSGDESSLAEDHPEEVSTLPWFPATWTLIPYRYSCLCCCSNNAQSVKLISNKVDFAKTITWRSIQLLTGTLLLTALQASGLYIAGNIWFQFINVYAQLDILVAFCQHGSHLFVISPQRPSKSIKTHWTVTAAQYAVRLLRHPWSQWFGELSMSLYMVHWPVIFYACWFQHGSLLHWPHTLNCSEEYVDDDQLQSQCQNEVDAFNQARTLQYWMIPVIALVAIGLASLLYYGVEVPVRTYLK